jgi:L-iditol 2-dehydrogenase
MKAAIFEGIGKIKVKEIEKPQPKKGEILLKVMACAVCGTDIRIINHGHPRVIPPFIIGHEIAGIIEEIRGEIVGFRKGDRVVVALPGIPCGECFYCKNSLSNLCPHKTSIAYELPGGFSEYMIIPQQAIMKGNVIKIPSSISLDEACIVEPLACCINGQRFLTISTATTILIMGSGPIGLMHMQLAKAKGARNVGLVDISSSRIEKAKSFKPDFLINSNEVNLVEEIRRKTNGMGVNAVIVACSSKEAIKEAFEVILRGGEILLFAGLPKEESQFMLDLNVIHYNELKIYGSFASTDKSSLEAMMYIRDRRINIHEIITHHYRLEEIGEAIEMAKSGEALKVIITPHQR